MSETPGWTVGKWTSEEEMEDWPKANAQLLMAFEPNNAVGPLRLIGVGGAVEPEDIHLSQTGALFQTPLANGDRVRVCNGSQIEELQIGSPTATEAYIWQAGTMLMNPSDPGDRTTNKGDVVLITGRLTQKDGRTPNHDSAQIINFPPGSSFVLRSPVRFVELQNKPPQLAPPPPLQLSPPKP